MIQIFIICLSLELKLEFNLLKEEQCWLNQRNANYVESSIALAASRCSPSNTLTTMHVTWISGEGLVGTG
ncbi:hypothetical protein Y032_0794g2391 [Ancylostoma ceylanicum]|uniref:Uncharacterized protein n=1 Tax=Ancylostoma ceylanicum TaxID=53326 RepID=A0A016WCP0_9BILA|nr:hypothetical protein Y032_0794g2391 [Ancylostoma ceylanicum]